MARRQIITEGTYGMVRRGAIIKPTTIARTVQPTPRADVVRLNTGEQVATSEFNQLTIAQQAYLRKFGVDAFNREQARVAGKHIKAHEQAEAFVKRQIEKQERWYGKNIVEVGKTKEPILKSVFDKLPPARQKLLQEKGITEYNKQALLASEAHAYGPDWTGEQVFRSMIASGDIPKSATFVSYTPKAGAMGDISYTLPDPRSGEQVFRSMIASGDIPKDATYAGYSPEKQTMSFSLPETMTARTQFDHWKATDPIAPQDAVYQGASPDGGFMYSSPSATLIEVETVKGKVTMPMTEWEVKSDIKQFELVLGRPPTKTEWEGYRLMEAGAALPWWKELIPGVADIIGTVAMLIPGEIEEERYVRISKVASGEWQKAYPELLWSGAVITGLESIGFSAAKAMYPRVTVKDVTGKEWAMTGLNVALWALPVWLPKVVKGIKVLIPNKLTARLRTVPFSEKAGLVKAPAVKKTAVLVKTIGARQIGMSGEQFSRFVKARVANPKLTPEIFKFIESVGSKLKVVAMPAAKRIVRRKPSGLPRYTHPRTVGAGYVSKADWLRLWKPSQVQATFATPELVPPGWVLTSGGKYMPVGVRPISLPDVPVGLVIRTPVITSTGRIITPITTAQIVKSLGLTQAQIAGKQSLSTVQAGSLAKALGISRAEAVTMAKQGKLSQVVKQKLTALQNQMEGLTNTQALALTRSLTRLETKALTQQQTQSLSKTLGLTMTETQMLLSSITQLEPVTQQAVQELLKVDFATKPRVRTKVSTKVSPKVRPKLLVALPNGKSRHMTEDELAGAVAWKQGFIYKLIYPPYGEGNIIHSRKPFPGVRTAKGADSAYKTVTKLGVELPESIKRDMGIMDIEIVTSQLGRGRPKITFDPDIAQERWHVRGKRVKSRRLINRKRTDRRARRLQQSASAG